MIGKRIGLFGERLASKVHGRPPTRALCARGLRIGRRCSFEPGVKIDASHAWLIDIGDDVTLAPNVLVFAHDASTKAAVGLTRIARVRIGDRVFVGAGCVILPGASIGDDCIIGAGSVVGGEVPDASVAVGCPAVVIGSREAFDRRQRDDAARLPTFDASWTVRGGIDHARRERMRELLASQGGFVA